MSAILALCFTWYVRCVRVIGSSSLGNHLVLDDHKFTKDKMIAEAAATDDPNAPHVPGEAQCKYCAHGGACTARTQVALATAGITFANLDVAQSAADKEPSSMDDRQLREILEAAPLLRQMIEAAEAEALRRFEAGQNVEGLKAVRGRGSKSWMHDDEQMEAELKKLGLPKDAIWSTKIISPAQAEKVRWTKRDGTECQLDSKKLAKLKKELIKTSEGKIQIVASADPRPAVTLSAAAMFTAVPSDLPSFLL